MEDDLLLSSDDEADAEYSGHPFEDKASVLENLQNGFQYHKNGPAQMYDWSADDIQKMTLIIKDSVSDLKKGRRKIRAVNYLGEEFPGGLLGWVNNVREGVYFGDNPNVQRGPRFSSGEKTNHWLWNFVSETLLSEFHLWSKIHRENSKAKPSGSKYPKLNQLIFRHTEDFVGGLWCDFHKHWQPFINEMRFLITNLSLLTYS